MLHWLRLSDDVIAWRQSFLWIALARYAGTGALGVDDVAVITGHPVLLAQPADAVAEVAGHWQMLARATDLAAAAPSTQEKIARCVTIESRYSRRNTRGRSIRLTSVPERTGIRVISVTNRGNGLVSHTFAYQDWYIVLLTIHSLAAQYLRRIKETDPGAFRHLMIFLDQLRKDEKLQGELLTHKFGDDGTEPIGVKKWVTVQNKERLPVWRLRVWDLESKGLNYRIVYFYCWPEKRFYVMAVAKREHINYDDPTNEIRRRVVDTIRAEFPIA